MLSVIPPNILQKKCVRNIEGVNLRFHTDWLLKKYEILKLEDLFTFQTTVLCINLSILNVHHLSTTFSYPSQSAQLLYAIEKS